MKENSKNIGILGETLVSLELQDLNIDVMNINTVYRNYKNADLICMNSSNGKSVMVQVKTGSTHNILTGFTSELDGEILDLETSVVGPWVFVYMPDDCLSNIEFYILTKEEVIKLISTSNTWYVTQWNRDLKRKPMVGIEVKWLRGENSEGKASSTYTYPPYINPLNSSAKDKWNKITDLVK